MHLTPEQIERQYGTFIKSVPDCIPNSTIKGKIDHYKSHILKKFTPLAPTVLDEFRDNKAKWDIGAGHLHVSIKIDGQSAFLIYHKSQEGIESYFCSASSHRVYLGLEANKIIEKFLGNLPISSIIIAGEIYSGTREKDTDEIDFEYRSHVYDFIKLVNDPSGYQQIGFRAFDILEVNDENWLTKKYSKRKEKLDTLFPDHGRVAVVRTLLLKKEQLAEYYEQIVNEGKAEGIVIRNADNHRNYKVKPINPVDVVIIGVVSGRPGSKIKSNQIGSSLVALRYQDGTYQVLGRVGGGLTAEDRTLLWSKMTFVESEYTGVTKDGRAFQMVSPQHVAVIDYLDLYTHSYDNKPKMQSCLKYDAVERRWTYIRQLPFVALISPRFRAKNPLHDDKQPKEGQETDINDVRVEQVTSFTALSSPTSVAPVVLPPSKLIAKFIFEYKEKIKKFVLWATNKHDVDSNYPRFVIFFTDYSPTRQDPLKRSIRSVNDAELVFPNLGKWIKEEMENSAQTGLKRGWKLFKAKNPKKYKFDLSKPSGFITIQPVEQKENNKEKIITILTKSASFLSKLSRTINLVLPEPANSLDHAVSLLKQGNRSEFDSLINQFNKSEWVNVLAHIKDEKPRERVKKIIILLEKLKNN